MAFFRPSYFVYDVTELTSWKVDITVQEPYTIRLLDLIMSNCKMLPNIFFSSLQSGTSQNITLDSADNLRETQNGRSLSAETLT